jgi:hypothetical protein
MGATVKIDCNHDNHNVEGSHKIKAFLRECGMLEQDAL